MEVPFDGLALAPFVCFNGRNGCLSSSVFFLLRSTAVRNAVICFPSASLVKMEKVNAHKKFAPQMLCLAN
ncbi:uncharacterized [Tachysurus ichikawai]